MHDQGEKEPTMMEMEMNVHEIADSIRTILSDKEGVTVSLFDNSIRIQGSNPIIHLDILRDLLGQYGCIYPIIWYEDEEAYSFYHNIGNPRFPQIPDGGIENYLLILMTIEKYEKLIELLHRENLNREDEKQLTYYRNQIARNYFAEKSSYVLK